ncbi:hypothetical protein ACI8AC_12705 [Geodermatophilus sp. SYSU D00758]
MPDTAWIYRSFGEAPLSFRVPAGAVVHTPAGEYVEGEFVTAADLTIHFGVS